MSPETPPPPSVETGGRDSRKGGRPGGDTRKGNPTIEDVSALIAPIIVGGSRYTYRITYQREGWQKPSTKLFESETGALRYAKRLQRTSDPELAPLCLLVVERRAVAPWAHVVSLIGEKGGQS